MEITGKRLLQVTLSAMLVAALVSTGRILYQRRQAERPPKDAAPARELKSDDFVFLRSLHAYDVASARKLEGKTVWVKGGNAVAYFKPGTRQPAGLLAPIAALKVTKVAARGDQVMATFTFAAGGPPGGFTAPIGAVSARTGDTNLIVDELFYYDDPRRLYAHWPPEVWAAIERHAITSGMNEIQAGMAMGVGRAVGSASGDYGNRTLQFTHAGKTVEVLFRDNRAARVEPRELAQ